MKEFDELEVWKAIVLYGLNTATYKMGLGKTLLNLAAKGKTEIGWHELAEGFFDQYHLKLTSSDPLPQQGNASRKTVMERIVRRFQLGQMTREQAIVEVSIEGLNDVIPRFQKIGKDSSLVNEKFFHFDFGKKLYLNDALFSISETSSDALHQELDARWSLLEGAFSVAQSDFEIVNDARDIYLQCGHQRKGLTSNIPFLQGYQGNLCFYCAEPIMSGMHVDHVLPRQVLHHDEIWNLVLAHDCCNLNKLDSVIGLPYLEKLYQRNENIMGSNHPWKRKIEQALGSTTAQRRTMLQWHYGNVLKVIGPRYWEGVPDYNREHDMFFRKLITRLNNG